MSYQGMERDRKFILASAEELEIYLSSDVLLWPLRGHKDPLSPGNLLLSQARLALIANYPALSGSLDRIRGIIYTRRKAWLNRVEKEIPLRLNQYRGLIEDYIDAGAIDAGYRDNISARVKLDLLLNELDNEPEALLRSLEELDGKLSSLVNEGEFIWESDLQDFFPKDRFGYLYIKG